MSIEYNSIKDKELLMAKRICNGRTLKPGYTRYVTMFEPHVDTETFITNSVRCSALEDT